MNQIAKKGRRFAGFFVSFFLAFFMAQFGILCYNTFYEYTLQTR